MTTFDRVIAIISILTIGLGLFVLLTTDRTLLAMSTLWPALFILVRLGDKASASEQLAQEYERGVIDGYYDGFHSRDECKHNKVAEHCLLCRKSIVAPDPYHYYAIKDDDDPKIKKQFGEPEPWPKP